MKLSLVLIAAIGCVPFLLIACGSTPATASTPRDQARAAILTIAEGVKTGDAVCAEAALALKKADLAKGCADAYDDARSALLAAEAGVDAWDNGARGEVACASSKALAAVVDIENLLAANGVEVPAVVTDAVKLGQVFLPLCAAGDGGSDG